MIRLRDWFILSLAGFLFGLVGACATYPDREDFGTFQVITASAEQVSTHCHDIINRYNRQPVTTGKFNGKRTILRLRCRAIDLEFDCRDRAFYRYLL